MLKSAKPLQVDAVVLAGARNDGQLQNVSSAEWEALIEIGGRPMVSYVVAALSESAYVDNIIVVGPPALRETLSGWKVKVIPCGETMIDNLKLGLRAVAKERKALIATSDIPLITTRAIDDFLGRCERTSADIYYPITSKEVNERKYPGVKRTYVRLREGTYTGGNLALVEPQIVDVCDKMISRAMAMRKKPWQLSRLLGFRFIVKFFFNRLTLPEIEQRIQLVLGFTGVGIVSPFPEVGIDVDKPSDLELCAGALAEGDE